MGVQFIDWYKLMIFLFILLAMSEACSLY